MKEPTGHYEASYGCDDWEPQGRCDKDGESWPCKKWKAWLASPEFRLKVLESRCDTQAKNLAEQGKELRQLREKSQLLDLLFAGYRPAINDAVTRLGGSINYKRTAHTQDMYAMGGTLSKTVITGRVDHMVTFKDADGSIWENGHNVERHYRK